MYRLIRPVEVLDHAQAGETTRRKTYLLPDVTKKPSQAHTPRAGGEGLVSVLDFTVQRRLWLIIAVGTVLGFVVILPVGILLDIIINKIHAAN